jgi:hypothetical protein
MFACPKSGHVTASTLKKSILLVLCSVFTVANGATMFMNVEGEVVCQGYSDFSRQYYLTEIRAYVDDEGYVYIEADHARAAVASSMVGQIIQLLQKAQAWASKAKAEKIEVTKDLDPTFHYNDGPERIALRFISGKGADDQVLVVLLRDYRNHFIYAKAVLSPDQIGSLINLFKSAPDALKKLKENKKKTELFK